MYFFFQAEDGIRDLVRSRGLGDVYKRQGGGRDGGMAHRLLNPSEVRTGQAGQTAECPPQVAVSYTHLTLPTSDLV